jgi:Polyketide cyclase / dehydrase and lipid transport
MISFSRILDDGTLIELLSEVAPMVKVCVIQHIAGDLDAVFDLVSNHELFLGRFPGIAVRIVTPGSPDRNGLGCIREVMIDQRIRYLEEITEWTRPVSFEYFIREASMPIQHYGSRLEFVSSSNGTDVTWTSQYDVPIPLIGWAVGFYMKRQYEIAFRQILQNAGKSLEATV